MTGTDAADRAGTPVPERANVVVIGAGIMGLATAFNLARLGVEKVVVIERGYLCGGASGRNGGGIRANWSNDTLIRLMKESLRICTDFATRMRMNVWFRQGGYMFLARGEERAKQLAEAVRLQNEHGLSTRMIEPAEAKRIVPELDASRLVAASYSPDDGIVFPWPFVWGYARACENLGVAIHTFTEVADLETEHGRITGVVTDRGRIETPLVVNATGAWSPQVARMVDVELPNRPHRHEICSTEPLKPFLKPLVADLGTGLYCSQSTRGEIVGGIGNAEVPEGLDQGSSMRFLGMYARSLTATMPVLGRVRVLRQWAGCYDLTPDGSPIVGPVDEVEGLVLLCGFMGHGFMIAPVMGRIMADWIVHGEERELVERWSLRRYREGRLLEEGGMNLG